MATAENRGENLKSFVTRRKAEYRSKFPFLTDSQVVAKLKRLWKSQQARAALASDTNCPTAFAAAAKSKEAGHLCCGTNVHRDVVALTDKGQELDQDPSHCRLQMMKPSPLSNSISLSHTGSLSSLSQPNARSPTDKENVDIALTTPTTSSSPSGKLPTAVDCYTFTEDDTHKDVSKWIKSEYRGARYSISSSSLNHHNTTELKSHNSKSRLKESNPSSSGQAAGRRGRSGVSRSKRGSGGSTAIQRQGKKNVRWNLEAGGITHSGGGGGGTTSCRDAIRDCATNGGTLKGEDSHNTSDSPMRLPCLLSEQRDDTKPAPAVHTPTCAGHQRQEQLPGGEKCRTCDDHKPVVDSVDSRTKDDVCVYRENGQVMGRALGRQHMLVVGSVESSCSLLGDLDGLSHGHGVSADSAVIINDRVLGNVVVAEAIPTPTCASDSSLCQGQKGSTEYQPETLPSQRSSSTSTSLEEDGTGRCVELRGARRRRGRGRGRGRGRRRGRGTRRKGEQNDSWIDTSSQPQTCESLIVGESESSQNEQLSCSLPECLQEDQESLDSNVGCLRNGFCTRASLGGKRKRQRGRGARSGEFSGRMTRSRAAALRAAEKEEEVAPSSLESGQNGLPPTKKSKPRQHDDLSHIPSPGEPAHAAEDSTNGCLVAGSVIDDASSLVSRGGAEERCTCDAADGLGARVTDNKGNIVVMADTGQPSELVGGMETPSLVTAATGDSGVASTKCCKSSSPSPLFAQCSTSLRVSPLHLPGQETQGPVTMKLQTPLQMDPLCDMFLPLTPEREKCDLYQDIGSYFDGAPTERRTMRPAVESEEKGYCLFADDADIFL